MFKALGAVVAGALLVAASPSETRIDDLGWMSGHWESVSGERWVEEIWSGPRGGTMFAISRTGTGDSLREFEFLRLQRGADGNLAYVASPFGGRSIAFPLVEATESSATFANPGHDFPQLIRYERQGGTMRATISASDGSGAVSWTFRRLP